MNKEQAVTYLKFSGFSDEQIKAIEGAFTCDKCVYSTSEGCQYDDITETIPPFDDLIQRQAVLDAINTDWHEDLSQLEDAIKALPPVEPKTGHWIPSHIPESILDECSECGFSNGSFTFNYCPNCGAKMVKPQESEKINCKTTKCENCQNHNYCDYEPQESEEKPKSEWQHDHEILKAHSDGANAVLDKIRAEIEKLAKPNEFGGRGNGKSVRYGLCKALEIIDKYKAEGSDKE